MALPTLTPQPRSSRSGLWLGAQAWAIRRLHALHRNRTAAHLETGVLGEREALFYLRRRGYTVVARRWKAAALRGDIDLIAWHAGTLCFIEVKTRSHRDTFAAEFAVDDDKQRFLRRLARAYIHRIPKAVRPATARFDVLSLYLAPATGTRQSGEPEFVLNQGAFGWA
jgi:putative endonuclease